MSKAIMQYIILVIVFLVVCVGVAIFVILQKIELEKQNEVLNGQVAEYETKQQSLTKQISTLTEEANKVRTSLEKKNQEAEDLKRKNTTIQSDLDRITEELDQVAREKESLNSRIGTLSSDRDKLMRQVSEAQEFQSERDRFASKVKELEKIISERDAKEQAAVTQQQEEAQKKADPDGVFAKENEEYTARLEREKAGLLIEIDKVKQELAEVKLKITDLVKINSDLDVEIGRLKNEKEEIVGRIKYGENLADNLSIELARARNDQRMTTERASKVDEDNKALRSEIKQLTSTKLSLEKSIARLTDDKAVIEKKLLETEGIIQSRIDEIWKIKKDIDKRFDIASLKTNSAQVELAPIVVNANGPVDSKLVTSLSTPRPSGVVVSVNEDNNFIVVDMGEKSGVKPGEQFRVYRNGGQIGLIEIIQVRQDISAADIRQKSMSFKPGDTVK
jgi:uncharacterized protein YoxC